MFEVGLRSWAAGRWAQRGRWRSGRVGHGSGTPLVGTWQIRSLNLTLQYPKSHRANQSGSVGREADRWTGADSWSPTHLGGELSVHRTTRKVFQLGIGGVREGHAGRQAGAQ